MHLGVALLFAGTLVFYANALAVPSDVFTPVPGVTAAMEQDFLARYKAAIAHQDVDALKVLYGTHPPSDKRFRDLAGFSLAMQASLSNPAYAFTTAAPGQHNPPYRLEGKIYVDDMPAVLILKASSTGAFPKAGGFTGFSELLGLENGQLVFIGTHEDEHAVLPVPPAPTPATPNYNLKPVVRTLPNDGSEKFGSLHEFLSTIGQLGLEMLASGQNDLVYFGVYRLQPNFLVYADGSRQDEANYTFQIRAQDAAGTELQAEKRWIDLVDGKIAGDITVDVQGTVFQVPADYHGRLTIRCNYTPDGSSQPVMVSRTIDWK